VILEVHRAGIGKLHAAAESRGTDTDRWTCQLSHAEDRLVAAGKRCAEQHQIRNIGQRHVVIGAIDAQALGAGGERDGRMSTGSSLAAGIGQDQRPSVDFAQQPRAAHAGRAPPGERHAAQCAQWIEMHHQTNGQRQATFRHASRRLRGRLEDGGGPAFRGMQWKL
jgi:hypothetical protein